MRKASFTSQHSKRSEHSPPPACNLQYMTECTFNFRMLKNIITECHIYDEENNYKPFDFAKEEPMFAVQRQMIPNTM